MSHNHAAKACKRQAWCHCPQLGTHEPTPWVQHIFFLILIVSKYNMRITPACTHMPSPASLSVRQHMPGHTTVACTIRCVFVNTRYNTTRKCVNTACAHHSLCQPLTHEANMSLLQCHTPPNVHMHTPSRARMPTLTLTGRLLQSSCTLICQWKHLLHTCETHACQQ